MLVLTAAETMAYRGFKIEDDQVELLILTGLGSGALSSDSRILSFLARYPDTLEVDSNGKLEWGNDEYSSKNYKSDDEFYPNDNDVTEIANVVDAEIYKKFSADFRRSSMSDQHVRRAIKLSKEVTGLTKGLALGSAGGRMAALSRAKNWSMDRLAKGLAGGRDAEKVLNQIESSKIVKLSALVRSRVDISHMSCLELNRQLILGNSDDSIPLVATVAYKKGDQRFKILWNDFAPDHGIDDRELISWNIDQDGTPFPTGSTNSVVHTCVFGNYEYFIIIGRLSEGGKSLLKTGKSEEILKGLEGSQQTIMFSRPGSPILGVSKR